MKTLMGKTRVALSGLKSEGSSVAATIRVVFKMTWAHLNRAAFAGPSQLVQAEWAARGIKTSAALGGLARQSSANLNRSTNPLSGQPSHATYQTTCVAPRWLAR